MRVWKLIKPLLLSYAALVGLFLVSLVIAAVLPENRVRANIRRSLPLLQAEGDRPRIGGEGKDAQLANWTDSLMLNIIYNIEPHKPFKSAMEANYFAEPGKDLSRGSMIDSFAFQLENDLPANTSYARYWHGYLVILRPLFLFFTLSEIRRVYQFVFLVLFASIAYLVGKRICFGAVLIFAVSLASINFLLIPLSFQYSSVFLIAFIASVIVLLFKRLSLSSMGLLFLIIGALTSFVDLLTAPLVTFGLPVILVYLIGLQNKHYPSLREAFKMLLVTGLFWGMGYGLLWASKWLVASMFLPQNVISDGLVRIFTRSWGDFPSYLNQDVPLFVHALRRNAALMFTASKPQTWGFLAVLIGWVCLLIFRHKPWEQVKFVLPLVVMALFPYAWYIFAANHSVVHAHFTYRIQLVTVLASLAAMLFSIDWGRIHAEVRGKATRWGILQRK